MEHPNLPPDPSTREDVCLLVVQGQGRPRQGVEILLGDTGGKVPISTRQQLMTIRSRYLDILVLVLHEHGAGVNVDNANGIAPEQEDHDDQETPLTRRWPHVR